jgi:hypothetical protein
MSLLKLDGYKCSKYKLKAFEKIHTLLIITMENGGLRSHEMAMSCLGSAQYLSVQLMLL